MTYSRPKKNSLEGGGGNDGVERSHRPDVVNREVWAVWAQLSGINQIKYREH